MSETEAVIRPAEAADAPAVAACVTAAYGMYVARIGKPPGPMLDDYAAVIANHWVFVLTEAGVVVGALVLIRQAGGVLLDNVAVHPDHQGRGLGRRMIDFAEAEARRRGYAALDLYTHEAMTENVAMYRALGYAETGRRIEHGYPRVYMRKPL
jgi:ribosomal protein S18 acetylase RimI-like enzyme